MSFSGVTLRRKADTIIPEAVLELMLKHNPHAWGAAVVDEEGLKISRNLVEGEHTGEGGEIEFITDTMKNFMAYDMVFQFVNSNAAINLDDVGPYGLLSVNGETQDIACFVHGDFNSFAKKESSHPPEFFFVNEYLVPKITDLAELADNDIAKIMKAVNKKTFKDELMAHCTGNATVTIIANTGEILTYSQGEDNSEEFPWGWCSNTYGFGKTEPAKPEKSDKGFPKRSTTREKHVASTTTTPTSTKADTAVATVVKQANTLQYTIAKKAPPAHLSRGQTSDWYKARIGFKPPGAESKIPVEVYVDKNGRDVPLHEIKKQGIEIVSLPKLNNSEMRKDTEPHTVKSEQTLPVETKSVTDEILPIMGPKTREAMKDIIRREDVQKIIAENASVVMDPAKLAQEELKFPEFGKQLGLKDGLKDFMCLNFPWFMKMAKDNPEGMANFAWSMKNVLIAKYAKEAAKLTQGEVHTVAQQELKEDKKPSFPKRKTA